MPPLTVSEAKEAPAPIRRLPVPENVTVDVVAVNVVADEVSQLPELIVIVAEARVMVAAPLDVRLLAPKAMVPAFVKVRTPLHVSEPANVVEIVGFTVRLFTVCVTLIVPPETSTTTVDVPVTNPPRCVSIEVTVIVDPLAVRDPPAFTLSVTALIARFEPLVFNVVVPAPPAIVSVPPTFRLFPAIVKVTVEAPELNVTLPPNSWVRLARVIVRARVEVNVMAAAKFQEADVDESVHAPDAVQEPPADEPM